MLVNNAGVARDGILGLFSDDDLDTVIDLNLKGTLYVTRLVSRRMLARRSGAIVNISSIVGLSGYRGLAVYSATKAALDGLTRALARELGSRGITVNSVAPGYLRTEMSHGLDEGQMEQITRRTPAGRLGDPEDIARVVQFLTAPGRRLPHRPGHRRGRRADGMSTGAARRRVARLLPAFVVTWLDRVVFGVRRRRVRLVRRLFAALGFNVVKHADYYSTLPVLEEIEKTRARWDRPSALPGIDVDVPSLEKRLGELSDRWEDDYRARCGPWAANAERGFGPGYPAFDARTLYYMLREHRPARYLEVGSGLSTYYAHLAADRQRRRGRPARDHLHRAVPLRGAATRSRASSWCRTWCRTCRWRGSRSSRPVTCCSSTPRTR